MLKRTLCSTLLFTSMVISPATLLAHSWTLDGENSSVTFVSTKKDKIAETHYFKKVTGEILGGEATISIDATSIDSGVGIRDERMTEHLFETKLFPSITISADTPTLTELEINKPKSYQLPATLALHGIEKEVELNVIVTKLSDATLSINSSKPVLVSAEDFGMTDGILKLANLVGDIPITKTVPTYFTLYFSHN